MKDSRKRIRINEKLSAAFKNEETSSKAQYEIPTWAIPTK